MRGPSRREFLGGAAGLAAAAALPASAAAWPVSATARPVPARSPSRQIRAATTPVTGATVDLASYGDKNYLDAAKTFDGYVGLPLGTTIQKVYMGTASFPRTRRSR